MTPYERVDMEFQRPVMDPKWAKKTQTNSSVWVSYIGGSIYVLLRQRSFLPLGCRLLSDQYAVPNYLSSRRVNVKVAFKVLEITQGTLMFYYDYY